MKKLLLMFLFCCIFIAGCQKTNIETNSMSFSSSELEDFSCDDCNVILISIDTLRADHLGIYGYYRNTSPNIDDFAAKSVLFTNSYSSSAWTYPSHFSMLTGRYVTKTEYISYPNITKINDSYIFVAEILKDEGYKTAAFTGGVLISEQLGFSQGFENFTSKGIYFENNCEQIFNWIEQQNKTEKFFLFIHGYNVHSPYDSPVYPENKFVDSSLKECEDMTLKDDKSEEVGCRSAKEQLNYKVAQYDSEIFYVDLFMAKLFDELKKEGLYDKSIIIITSDHGEEFQEHGRGNHVSTLYNEIIKVPLIIKIPGMSSQIIDSKVSSIDLVPTILGVLNVSSSEIMDGKNVMYYLAEGNTELPIYTITGRTDETILGDSSGFMRVSIIDKQYKLIYTLTKNNLSNYELFDLDKDEEERYNIILDEVYQSVVSDLGNKLNEWIKENEINMRYYGVSNSNLDSSLDEQTKKQLKSLGYIN